MSVPDRSEVGMDTELYEQYILNRSFDPEFNVLAVELLGHDTQTNALRRIRVDNNGSIGSAAEAVRIDDATTPSTTYIGKAAIGSSTSASVWQVARLDTSSGLIKTWADGDSEYDNVWDDRTMLNYS